MKHIRTRWAFLPALLLAAIFLASCSRTGTESAKTEDAKRVIKIGYLPITHAGPLYIEQELAKENPDFAKDFELELVKFGSWPDLIEALNAGRIDGASVLVQAAMKARGQGIPIKAVALGHREGNVVVTTPDINEVSDLKGKTFAIPHKFSTHNVLLYQMLKQANIPYSDVNVVEMAPAEMPAALAQKRVAGYSVAEPFGAISVDMDNAKVLFQSGELWKGSICCVLVLRESFIDEEHDLAQEFVTDYAAAGKRAQTKDDEVRSTLRKDLEIDENVLDLSLGWISYDDLRLDKKSYTELTDFLTEMKLGDGLPTYDEFVDPTLLENAANTANSTE